MTDTNTKKTNGSKSPTHYVYQVLEREGSKPFWRRIGSAWTHADQQGFNIQLECLPLEGKIVLRVVSENKE